MKTQLKATSPTLPPDAQIATPILAGYYYAIADNIQSKNSKYTLMQISDITRNNGITQLKIQQFVQAYKVLPEFINPAYLGTPAAQFWLDRGEFLSWQPLLLQRGTVFEQL